VELGLTLVGLSHRTAPLEVRERYVVSGADLSGCLAAIAGIPGVDEAFVLSTCNRTEALVAGDPGSDPAPSLRAHLFRNLPDDQVYVWRGVHALIHVFRVASGLDSMVVGESEVLGQMKRGFDSAQEAKTLGPLLRALLPQALHVGKRVRAETAVGKGTLSVARVAVDVASQAFGRFERCRAVVVGAGETGMLVARHLEERGLRSIVFANRTVERAREAAAELGGEASGLESLPSLVARADVVVTCIEGSGCELGAASFDRRALKRRDRPLLAIDLSVPRAIERDVGKLPNVLLYDLDDLQRVVAKNRRGRDGALEESSGILVAELHKFLALRAYASFTPAITAMRRRFETVRDEVLDSVAGARSDKKDLEIAHEMCRKLLDVALDHMKEGARATSSEDAIQREYRRFLAGLGAGGPEEERSTS
jgi:glutamyl-tRNA reductase